MRLFAVREDIFEMSDDPTMWSQVLRALRFMVCHSVDAEQITGPSR